MMLASLFLKLGRPGRMVVRPGLMALIVAAWFALPATIAGAAAARQAAAPARSPYYSVARDYTIRYYPRFMTAFQQSLAGANRIAGPNRVGPLYGFVVSINVDTIYASFYLDLSQGPQIFTIPKTDVSYSLLTLDVSVTSSRTTSRR